MRLVILGGPGAGKGTQAELLCSTLSIPLLALGDILREAIAEDTDLGKLAVSYVERGELVPDATMIQFGVKLIVKSWINLVFTPVLIPLNPP
ncbi:MAG: adenylate kinase family protein [Microcoleus sp.]